MLRVTDPINMGTYDYGAWFSWAHVQEDVTPWIEWGNKPYPTDPTSKSERYKALINGLESGGVVEVGIAAVLQEMYPCMRPGIEN